ncbi:MAG: hypothetical protein LBG99_08735 [Propionibacteriaceae bacterium]|jgi:hypothetical protein|nr:hypothetical protein [Propionibacteriaceae bacterium]
MSNTMILRDSAVGDSTGPRAKVKSVKVLGEEPLEEEILHAIAAAVVDYVSTGKEVKHQARFAPVPLWTRGARFAQLNNLPAR